MELIENEEDFTPENLLNLEKKIKPERIIIEYNGMWNFKNMKLPWHWRVEQQITTIDASTFSMYFTNMKSLLAGNAPEFGDDYFQPLRRAGGSEQL